jgi:molybdate-binding protein
LDFLFLTNERYDLVVPEAIMQFDPVLALVRWLKTPSTRKVIDNLGGYDSSLTGQVEWVG